MQSVRHSSVVNRQLFIFLVPESFLGKHNHNLFFLHGFLINHERLACHESRINKLFPSFEFLDEFRRGPDGGIAGRFLILGFHGRVHYRDLPG